LPAPFAFCCSDGQLGDGGIVSAGVENAAPHSSMRELRHRDRGRHKFCTQWGTRLGANCGFASAPGDTFCGTRLPIRFDGALDEMLLSANMARFGDVIGIC
jgi:hypothetical protein